MDALGPLALSLARQSVEHYVRTHALLATPDDAAGLDLPGAAFVTLRLRDALRGCIGTLTATRPTLAHEIIANAAAAAASDPRFPPVTESELAGLLYEVDILGDLEAILDEGDLDPEQYGVVVTSGQRRGVLLPALEGVVTATQQVAIARAKALIHKGEPITLHRFTVTRFREHR